MGIEYIAGVRLVDTIHGVASEDRRCVRFSCEKRRHTSQRQPMRPLFNSARFRRRPPGLCRHRFDFRRQPHAAFDERPRPFERQILFQKSKTTCPPSRSPMALKRAEPQICVIAPVMAFDAITLLWHPVPYEGVTCIP
jgi:hypothetical protein